MTRARERRRPGAVSPIALTPKVEPLPTPAGPALASVEKAPATQPAGVPQPAADGQSVGEVAAPAVATDLPAPAPRPAPVRRAAPVAIEADRKVARTFSLRESLVREAQTAVFRTGEFEGGYTSLNQLVVGAIERELERLAGEFNNGTRFPEHRGAFRTGRPPGV